MITNAILYFFTAIIRTANSILPEAEMPVSMANTISTITQYKMWFNFILPANSLIILVAFIATLEIAIISLYGANYVVKLVRGSG